MSEPFEVTEAVREDRLTYFISANGRHRPAVEYALERFHEPLARHGDGALAVDFKAMVTYLTPFRDGRAVAGFTVCVIDYDVWARLRPLMEAMDEEGARAFEGALLEEVARAASRYFERVYAFDEDADAYRPVGAGAPWRP